MKYFGLLLVSVFIVASCEKPPKNIHNPSEKELKMYAQHSVRTDPGKYAFMYEGLPGSHDSLLRLIKCQLVHPLEAVERGEDALEASRDASTPDVESILEQLHAMDSTGLHYDRDYDDRLVVACYHHSILLASMLRHQNIAVRIRAGYSRYFEKSFGIRFSHVVCEAWSEQEKRWIMLDPDRELVDMDESDFDLAGKAWINLKKGRYDPEKYTASVSRGLKGTVYLMELDASLLMGNEKMYYDLPLIVFEDFSNFDELGAKKTRQLEKLALLILNPDRKTDSIRILHAKLPCLQAAGAGYEEYIRLIMSRE